VYSQGSYAGGMWQGIMTPHTWRRRRLSQRLQLWRAAPTHHSPHQAPYQSVEAAPAARVESTEVFRAAQMPLCMR
jgi:hypothetical protein